MVKLAPRRPRWAGTLALVSMTLDLGVAKAPLVWTLPQADFETTPRAASLIAAAERAGPKNPRRRAHSGSTECDMLFPAEILRSPVAAEAARSDRLAA